MSEVVPVSGVQAISLKPDDPSSYIVFAGAMASGTKDADASRALLTFLQSSAVKEVIRTQGMATP
jgi:Bacterial extracellular solute-binding protein